MSRSYHVTVKELSKHSRKELEEMATDPNSKLHELAKKYAAKKKAKQKRKTSGS